MLTNFCFRFEVPFKRLFDRLPLTYWLFCDVPATAMITPHTHTHPSSFILHPPYAVDTAVELRSRLAFSCVKKYYVKRIPVYQVLQYCRVLVKNPHCSFCSDLTFGHPTQRTRRVEHHVLRKRYSSQISSFLFCFIDTKKKRNRATYGTRIEW